MVAEGYKNTEIGVIPEEWEVKSLGEIVTIIGGGTPSSFNKKYWNGKINWFTPTEIGISKYVFNSIRKISQLGYENSSAKMLPIGTVILTTRAGIGDLGILKQEACTNQGFQSFVVNEQIDNEFLYYKLATLKNTLLKNASGSTFLEISPNKIRSIQIPLPPLPEQTALATALSDADALITATEKLIAKKKAIKQGAMQELLKPQEGWEEKTLGEIGVFYKGKGLPKSAIFEEGNSKCIHYGELFLSYKEKIENIRNKTFNFNGAFLSIPNDVLMPTSDVTPNGLATASCIMEGDVLIGGDILVIRIPETILNGVYLSYFIRLNRNEIMKRVKGVTVYHLHASDMKDFTVKFPDIKQQNIFVDILNDMDYEISLLEQKLEKQKQIKQGMMQNLLTGKIRLLGDIEGRILPTNKTIKENTKYKDAVLITAIVNAFYSENYPLGRKKVQKLLYLVLRKQETSVISFKREAAGPYAHTVRYNGGETIAISKHYVNANSNKQGTIFSKGDNREEALAYIEKWRMQSFIDWLDLEFKYKNVNQLEVLTTVDMAICDLKKENKNVSLQTVKELIAADNVWKKKLEKPYFSNIEIQKAIDESNRLFGNG